MTLRERKPLGQVLIDQGLITKSQLDQALEEKRQSGEPLRQILIKLGYVNGDAMNNFFEQEIGVLKVSLKDRHIEPEVLKKVPEEICRKFEVVPISFEDNILVLGMVNPLDIITIDRIRMLLNCEVEPVLVSDKEVQDLFAKFFALEDLVEMDESEVSKEAENIEIAEQKEQEEDDVDISKLHDLAEEMPVIKLVNLIITKAVNEWASDIHIEPREDSLRIRLRIDGVLHPVPAPPKRLHSAIVSRIKILSGMDIAERRVPQDGRYAVRIKGREVDIRVSSVPSIHGEKIVMRLLDTTTVLPGLAQLGFYPDELKKYNDIIKKPWGILLVTGPTGSGKTTTLYASLNTIKSAERNIVTVEDPVEYRLDEITQVQVNVKAGLTFAAGLRAFLRQDPDIMMVGEIRDKETAEIAVQSALTGHLVLSTIHTNDAASTFTRLIDMGIEPFLVTSTILCIIAQRLVRRICAHCKSEYKPAPELIEGLDFGKPVKDVKFVKGRGCENCRNTGYKGRMAIFELLSPSSDIRKLVLEKSSADEIKKAARKDGMLSLFEDGLRKVLDGHTTIEEVLRVSREEETTIT
ncbi:MAG: type II secretion system protein GspE [Candidatus Omnitrophica bacterium]|nr:type II secretion system protein GspE [Candidatus Omnitrophota bacterium]